MEPDRNKIVGRVLHILGWLVVTPLAAVVLSRIFAWDTRSSFVVLNAISPVLLLPAWSVMAASGVARRWPLFGVASAVVAAHVTLLLPEMAAREPVPGAARSAPQLRLFNANVFAGNNEVDGFADEIRRIRPDVVVLQEATSPFLEKLDSQGVFDGMPYRVVARRDDPFGAAVVSRWPLTEDDIVHVKKRPVLVRATVTFGGRRLRLFAVHAVSPVAGEREEWFEDMKVIGEAVVAEKEPVLVVGDFNATWSHKPFRRLLDVGLTDAAAARGKPFEMTWPRNRRLLPAFARIDHVLTTPGVVVTSITTGEGEGSDHRPLVAQVVLLDGVSPSAAADDRGGPGGPSATGHR